MAIQDAEYTNVKRHILKEILPAMIGECIVLKYHVQNQMDIHFIVFIIT